MKLNGGVSRDHALMTRRGFGEDRERWASIHTSGSEGRSPPLFATALGHLPPLQFFVVARRRAASSVSERPETSAPSLTSVTTCTIVAAESIRP